jgi:hypothetical protein
MFGRLMRMMRGVQTVRVRDMRMMPGLVVVAGAVVLGGFAMMVGRILMMLGRALMMAAALVCLCAHAVLLVLDLRCSRNIAPSL